VWSDGTDFSFQNNHLASLTIAAPLAVTSGGTGVTTSTGTGSTVLSDSPTFTGTPAAPTPALSAAGTTVATVAAIQALYPVGSIYINAGVTTNPATLLGFGTWVAFGEGRVLIGAGSLAGRSFNLNDAGGNFDATLVSHNHTFSGNTGGQSNDHFHTTNGDLIQGGNISSPSAVTDFNARPLGQTTSGVSADHFHGFSGTTSTQGSSANNANLQPYITVAMWRRTA
jgi:hypothetical protein